MKRTESTNIYGVFAGDEHKRAVHAIAMGIFVGSAWAAGGTACWATATLIADSTDAGARAALAFLAAMVAGGVLQQLWFNFQPALRFGYGARVAGFGLTYFAVLASCAALGSWLPEGDPLAWAGFAAIYLALLAALTLVFTCAFRKSRAEYQEVLDRFHERRGKEE